MRMANELQTIAGVGPATAGDLRLIGIRRVRDLRGKNPEKLYTKLCQRTGRHIDRCALYVFRCVVYFASRKKHDPDKLKWWNWKDRKGDTNEPNQNRDADRWNGRAGPRAAGICR